MNSVKATALAAKLVELTKVLDEQRYDDVKNTLLAIAEKLTAVEVCVFGKLSDE